MIRIEEITVDGDAVAAPFTGTFRFQSGLQVVSAENSYGKSLAAKAVAWCLGLEAMFGVPDNDPSFFPLAVTEEIDLVIAQASPVIASRCSLHLVRHDGASVRLTRNIKGDRANVQVDETTATASTRSSLLVARRHSMADEHGGLQRFLFDWLGWPQQKVSTFKGGPPFPVYLENLAPLFFIEQGEGWTHLQALQVTRYGQQQITQVAVEYLLGATDAIEARLARQTAIQRDARLRAEARGIGDELNFLFARHGWAVDWSSGGNVHEIAKRWGARTVSAAVREDVRLDIDDEIIRLSKHADSLRHELTVAPVDPHDISAHSEVSQRAIELKTHRHELNSELHTLRIQAAEAEELLSSLEQRIHAATDVLRLKTAGVGRLDHIECPTCHRDLDPETFFLTDQSAASVSDHIDALKRDRELMRKNLAAIAFRSTGVTAALTRVDADLRDAERALVTVTAAVGSVRERLGQKAAALSTAERQIERLRDAADEVRMLQEKIDGWLSRSRELEGDAPFDRDLEGRLAAFTDALRTYLIALGHSAVTPENVGMIKLDEQYTPMLGERLLRSFGSASDRSRVVAAYSLALAAASHRVGGLHPGVVILDEPLQQNPDDKHRDLFSSFLRKTFTKDPQFQVIVFTYLRKSEVRALATKGAVVNLPAAEHFLASPAPPAPVAEVPA